MPRTREGVQYAIEELWSRMGLPQEVQSRVEIVYSEARPEPGSMPQVWIRRTTDTEIHNMAFGVTGSLVWLDPTAVFPTPEVSWPDRVPVLFWGGGVQDRSRFATLDEQAQLVTIHADIIAATLYMLTRWEEVVREERDIHERFPGVLSAGFRLGFLDRPIVDEYAVILREWLRALLPRVDAGALNSRVRITHDIDTIAAVPRGLPGLRRLAGAVLKRKSIAEAMSVGWGLVSGARSDVYYRRIFDLLEMDKRYGFTDVVAYVMATPAGRFDSGYRVDGPLMKDVLRAMSANGFQLGIHPGYETLGCPEAVREQKERLEKALGGSVRQGRQHFLRFSVPRTWRDLVEAGLEEDSTMGYADHEGFRCGTAHPFRAFDVQRNEVLAIREWPLIVMDGTLRQYRRLSPEDARGVVGKLARRAKRVGGTFVFLWHNSSFDFDWQGWGPVYTSCLQDLATL